MNKTIKTLIQAGAGALAFAGIGVLLSRKDTEVESDPNEVTLDADMLEEVDDETETDTDNN